MCIAEDAFIQIDDFGCQADGMTVAGLNYVCVLQNLYKIKPIQLNSYMLFSFSIRTNENLLSKVSLVVEF